MRIGIDGAQLNKLHAELCQLGFGRVGGGRIERSVAALRELSIAIGVLLGAYVLRERLARRRVLPALVLTVGAVVLALGVA